MGKRRAMEDAWTICPCIIELPMPVAPLADVLPPRLLAHSAAAAAAAAASRAGGVFAGEESDEEEGEAGAASLPGGGGGGAGPPAPGPGACLLGAPHEGGAGAGEGAEEGAEEGEAYMDTLHFFGVFDGHGGAEAALHCAQTLHQRIAEALAEATGGCVPAGGGGHGGGGGGGGAASSSSSGGGSPAGGSAGPSSPGRPALLAPAPPLHASGGRPSQPPPARALPAATIVDTAAAAGAAVGPHSHALVRLGGTPGDLARSASRAAALAAAGNAGGGGGPGAALPACPGGLLPAGSGDLADCAAAAAAEGGACEAASGVGPPGGSTEPEDDGEAALLDEISAGERAAAAAAVAAAAAAPAAPAAAPPPTALPAPPHQPAPPCSARRFETALADAFTRTDAEFAASDGDAAALVGTTAVVALVGSRQLYVANCGDSRAVLCRGGAALPLTDDHKAAREDETARVEAAGGQILFWNGVRVMGVLAVSRAIGDHCLRPFVIAQPEVTIIARRLDDELLLLASDGLWDVLSNAEAVALARRCLRRARQRGASRASAARIAATVLTRAAVDRGSRDNVTVVVVDLSPDGGGGGGGGGEAEEGEGGGVRGEAAMAAVAGGPSTGEEAA